MLRKLLLISIIPLQACVHQTQENHPNNLSESNKLKKINIKNNQLPNGLKLNLYRTTQISSDSDLWNEAPIQVQKVNFESLNSSEKRVYNQIESRFLNKWIKCNKREFTFTDYREFPFFEIKDYQPRVELNTETLTHSDIQQNIEWKGNVRIGFYQSLANDVVPFHTYQEPSQTYSLPNFSRSSSFRNVTLENGKVYYVERNKKTELITITETRDCKFVQEILKTTFPAES